MESHAGLGPAPALKAGIITDRAIDAPRPLKVIYIGAGVSGIMAAILFREMVPSLELVIYEKNPEVGGTWYENRYPGCACDIPSHSYQLTFESSTEWSSFYAGAPEILRYWQRVADKYDVRELVKFHHRCTEATWDEARSKWQVRLVDSSQSGAPVEVVDEADVFITGTGALNEWKWPSIPGLHSFEGTLLHTANWDESFDPTGKKVAVIGGGSSGIQVVPALVDKVSHMDHYVRSRVWIATQMSEEVLRSRVGVTKEEDVGSTNFAYTAAEQEQWRRHPETYVDYRKMLELPLQGNIASSKRDSPSQAQARVRFEQNMRRRLAAKPVLADAMIPDFPPLCKRLTPGPGYLEALTAPHVDVVRQPIASVDAAGIRTSDGVHRAVDAIVCATGFVTDLGAGFPIYGRDGVNLRQKYGGSHASRAPRTYLGLCTDNFPNFFQSLGPNAFQGAGNLLVMMEQAHRYMAQILRRMATGGLRTVEPKRRPVDHFTNYCAAYFQQTVYTGDCVSWYKAAPPGSSAAEQKQARITALWPGSSVHALKALETVRWEDFELEPVGHEFGWFGNGLTLGDEDPTPANRERLTWYLNGTRFLHEGLHGAAREKDGRGQAADVKAVEAKAARAAVDSPERKMTAAAPAQLVEPAAPVEPVATPSPATEAKAMHEIQTTEVAETPCTTYLTLVPGLATDQPQQAQQEQVTPAFVEARS